MGISYMHIWMERRIGCVFCGRSLVMWCLHLDWLLIYRLSAVAILLAFHFFGWLPVAVREGPNECEAGATEPVRAELSLPAHTDDHYCSLVSVRTLIQQCREQRDRWPQRLSWLCRQLPTKATSCVTNFNIMIWVILYHF